MTTLVERLRDAEGGMHAHCKNDNERYKCDRGSCACAERHVEMLEEAADSLERQARRIAVLEGALRRLFNLQPTQESSCNPTYWAAVQEARAALGHTQNQTESVDSCIREGADTGSKI